MTKREQRFVEQVWSYYEREGRHTLPWRKTKHPYHIVVSEIMLQQTQVERVLLKYQQFLKQFPTVVDLAEAPLSVVLHAWQGLGYNRRAKMLHQCALTVVRDFGGTFPRTQSELVRLPGIGPYTAGAVLAFAFNVAEPIIETNIRSVYLHHFFKQQTMVTDAEIMRIIERTVDRNQPRQWYYALMDYGSFIKKVFGNQNVKSAQYKKQTPFRGSDREIRGAILRQLMSGGCTTLAIHRALAFPSLRVDEQLERLCIESMVVKKKNRFYLPD